MKTFVCLKQVVAQDLALQVDNNAHWVRESDLGYEMNEPDSFALEESLRIRETHGGEVVVVAAGPARIASTIREALAKGADRALLIEDDRLSRADAYTTAQVLAAALKREERCDLVLTGLQSNDMGFGQTGVILAELLDLPHATIIVKIIVERSHVRVKRELEAGWFQDVELPLPSLLTVQSGINKPRYATLMGIKKAKAKPMRRYTLAELGIELSPTQAIRRLYTPQSEKKTQFLKGTADEVAVQLVEKLRFEARVL